MSTLSTAIGGMDVGDWLDFSTTGWTSDYTESEAGDNICDWSNSACWDATLGKVVAYVKGAHATPGKVIIYSEATNTWSTGETPSWADVITHANDGNAIDATNHILYFVREGQTFCYRYDAADDTWLSDTADTEDSGSYTAAVAYHADLSRLYYVYTHLYYYAGSSWTQVGTSEYAPSTYHEMEYNPTSQCIVFGAEYSLWKIDSAGSVTLLTDSAPIRIVTAYSNYKCVAEPASGNFLFYQGEGAGLYQMTPAGVFTQLDDSPMTGSNMAVPLTNYGAVMFLEVAPQHIWLYKHAESDTPPTLIPRLSAR